MKYKRSPHEGPPDRHLISSFTAERSARPSTHFMLRRQTFRGPFQESYSVLQANRYQTYMCFCLTTNLHYILMRSVSTKLLQTFIRHVLARGTSCFSRSNSWYFPDFMYVGEIHDGEHHAFSVFLPSTSNVHVTFMQPLFVQQICLSQSDLYQTLMDVLIYR